MRTTKAQVEGIFKRLAEACGKRIATSYNDVGAWRLDYTACYGGYNIEEIDNERGGISQPMGGQRMKAGEFWSACYFALRAIEAVKEGGAA